MADNLFEEKENNVDNEIEELGDSLLEETTKVPASKPNTANRGFLIAVSVLVGVFLVTVIALVVFAGLILPQRNAAKENQAKLVNAQNTIAAETQKALAFVQSTETKAVVNTATNVETNIPKLTKTVVPEQKKTTQGPLATSGGATEVIASSKTPEPILAVTTAVVLVLNTQELTETMSYLNTMLASNETQTITLVGTVGIQATIQTKTPDSPIIYMPEAMTGTAAAALTSSTPTEPVIALPDTGIADDLRLPLLFGSAAILVVIIFVVRRLRLSSH